MDNAKREELLIRLAKNRKANDYIRKYMMSNNGQMPSFDQVESARELSQSELAKISEDVQISTLVEKAEKETIASFDFVYDENSWNAAYNKENSPLAAYYEVYPDEDLWNVSLNRTASFNDKVYAVKMFNDAEGENEIGEASLKAGWVSAEVQKLTNLSDNAVYYAVKDVEMGDDVYELFTDNALTESANVFIKFESYSFPGFIHCWQGAINAGGASYPWCVTKIEPFEGTIKYNYNGGEDVYPYGEYRKFKNIFAIVSIPGEFGSEYALNNGVSSFDPSKLVVTMVKA